MQTQQHDDMFSAQLEHYEGADSAPGSEPCSGENGAGEGELCRQELCCQELPHHELSRYELGADEEEEIVTKPWPPLRW